MPESHALSPIADVIDPLPDSVCRRLLARNTLGRVGITSGGLPLILPVHYVYDDGVIVFRTGAGTKLRAAANGDVLAFEVDAYEETSGRGWSVMVLGRATVLTTEHGPAAFDPRADLSGRTQPLRASLLRAGHRPRHRKEPEILNREAFARRRLS